MEEIAATVRSGRQRNQSIEVCKLLAAGFVVFLHARFPDGIGELTDCISRCAVPLFFMISGYFNYGADSKTLSRRTKHAVSLVIWASLVDIVLGSLLSELTSGSFLGYFRAALPELKIVTDWILLQAHPFGGHLWYLNALVICYLILWGYVRFREDREQDYCGLYVAGFVLFAGLVLIDVVSPLLNDYTYYPLVHTAWFLGIPMFGTGLFLREHQDRLIRIFCLNSGKLLLLFIAGIGVNVLQMYTYGLGIVPFGTIFAVPALLLYLAQHPVICKTGWRKKLVSKCGTWSTWIYILHIQVIYYYDKLFRSEVAIFLGERESWLRPVIVLAFSTVVAALLDWAVSSLRCVTKTSRKRNGRK